MLDRIANDIWVEARPLRFLGVETGTRMTIVRLANGGLFVHSPVALDARTRDAVDALGRVDAIVAPSLFHHLYVAEWARTYPAASLSACPGLEKKRKDLRWSAVLTDQPEPAWREEIDQVFFGARTMENEVIFFHRKSKTIVSCDFIFNLASHPSPLTRTVARVMGQREPGATLLERVMIRDRAAAREQIGRVLAWGGERIVLAHGDIVASNGTDTVRRAYRWL
ncbi:MAG: hypothetical protein JWP87_6186 [Labilithrix sp.]|nr:hypothetical protein [Labilithrix sp.]